MKDLFNGLHVVELASVLAGPSAGMFFSELGAKVIKIENRKNGGDVTRQWKLPVESPDDVFSAYYASVNRGKKVMMADLKEEADKEKVLSLIKEADVVISNFKPGDEEALGMSYKQLKTIKKDIILGSINSYGSGNSRPGFDLILQAESGFMSMNGTPESGPLKMPVALIDLLAAHQLKEGLLLALIRRMKTGKGCRVSVSLYDAALASLADKASDYLMAGYVSGLAGSLHPNIAPYGEMLPTADHKHIVLAVGNNKQFAGLCRALKLETLWEDMRYRENRGRVIARSELLQLLSKASIGFDSAALLKRLEEEQVPAGKVRKLDEVFADPASAEMVREENREGVLFKGVSGNAFKLSEG
jgi:crotonobetainyl-CoA:carnitine CoA-transferase CaiB-like acyl-CoA transferase